MKKITLKDIQVLNEAVELLRGQAAHSREATLAPLVKETRDKLVEIYRAQAQAEVEAALAAVSTPEVPELILILGGWAASPYVNAFVTFSTPGSAFIQSLSYNFETQELRVNFRAGHVWSYLNVPRNVFEQVLAGDYDVAKRKFSVGKAYNRLLKHSLSYNSAPVDSTGERVVKPWTVVLAGCGRISNVALRPVIHVRAASQAEAYWAAKKRVEGWLVGSSLVESRVGKWDFEIGGTKLVPVF